MKIKLESLHLDFADDLAQRRQEAAIASNRAPRNRAPNDYATALAMHRIGARAEAAAKLYLNPVTWNAFAEEINNLPDLETWIDVKSRTKSWHNLIVKADDPLEWAYLLVCAQDDPVFEIVGWCWGHEAKQEKFWKDPAGGRPAFFVDRNSSVMKTPKSLYNEVRRRQLEGI